VLATVPPPPAAAPVKTTELVLQRTGDADSTESTQSSNTHNSITLASSSCTLARSHCTCIPDTCSVLPPSTNRVNADVYEREATIHRIKAGFQAVRKMKRTRRKRPRKTVTSTPSSDAGTSTCLRCARAHFAGLQILRQNSPGRYTSHQVLAIRNEVVSPHLPPPPPLP